jgi:hypothetical protein
MAASLPSIVTPATRLQLASQISLQELGADEGGVVLRLDSGELYTVNDTTLAFLRELDGTRTIADVARRMIEVFDVDEATLVVDLTDIASELMRESVVVIAA